MSPVTFMRQIYANGGKGFFDAFGHHPYSFPCSPLTSASWNAFTQTKYLHDVMVQNGDGAKKIWGTEAGAPTGANIGTCTTGGIGRSVTEATQSQFVADYFKGWYQDFGSFTGPLFWFQIRDNGTDPHNMRRQPRPDPAGLQPEAGLPHVPAPRPRRLTHRFGRDRRPSRGRAPRRRSRAR